MKIQLPIDIAYKKVYKHCEHLFLDTCIHQRKLPQCGKGGLCNYSLHCSLCLDFIAATKPLMHFLFHYGKQDHIEKIMDYDDYLEWRKTGNMHLNKYDPECPWTVRKEHYGIGEYNENRSILGF